MLAGQALCHPDADGDRRNKLVRPQEKRTTARLMVKRLGVSQRRVDRLAELDRK
ncbi:MAG: hypothetical protein K0S45_449 [Nitrospira sp.]|jgi:hypothetical protein|nr:hypothetical protein [Nitrospira sp.]